MRQCLVNAVTGDVDFLKSSCPVTRVVCLAFVQPQLLRPAQRVDGENRLAFSVEGANRLGNRWNHIALCLSES